MKSKFKISFIILVFILAIATSNLVSATIVKIDMNQNTEYVDGDINTNGGSKDTAATTIKAGKSGIPTKRAFLDFNTSIIPDTATINTIVLELNVSTQAAINLDFTGLANRSTLFTDADLATACAGTTNGSTNYLTADNTYNNVAADTKKNVTLGSVGSAAASNLSKFLLQDYFSICILEDPEGTAQIRFYSNETTSPDSQPNLYVNYTEAASNTPPYNLTLNYPTNNSQVNNTNTINFNFSFLDKENQSLNCNLTLDSVVNATNITSIEGNHSNHTITGITYGSHNWSVNCSDYELYNASDTFFFSVNDTLAPSYSGNSTNNTAARLNEDIQIYINLSDNNQLNFFLFEWNGSGTNNTNINGTIYQKTYNITLNLSINLSYGNVIAWKFRFNDSANIWNQTPYHYITVANTNPVINEILCYNLSKAINCSSLAYRNNLTVIRVNCTDADSQVLNISYNLTNINDSKVLIGSNATANDSALFNYSYNQLINDSGLFNLTITCHDKANTTVNSTKWYIEFGYLKTNLTIIFNNIDYSSGNVNARQHDWFKVILNITCLTAECGTINASLDPATAQPETHKPSVYAYTAAYFTLFIFLLIIVFAPILIIEDKKFTKKEDLILLLAITGVVLVYLALRALDRLL